MDNREIAAATLRYIDEMGLEAVSFRKVGAAIGVATMTLCNRFKSKENLLKAALAVMLEENPLQIVAGEPWDVSLCRIARHNRAMALAHPKAFPLFLQVPPFESPVREYTHLVFSSHSGQNLPDELPYTFLSLMHSFLSGFQLAGTYSQEARAAAQGEADPEADLFGRMFGDEAFERNLAIILRGLSATYGLKLTEK